MKFFKQLSLFVLLAVLALASCKKEEITTTEVITDPVTPIENHENGLLSRSLTTNEGLDLGCVSIDYPFGLLLLDSTTINIASEADFIAAMSDPDNFAIDFVYPLNVTDADGNLQTVNNAEELADLFANCIPNTGWGNDTLSWFFPAWEISFQNSCYQLTYPVTLLDMDSVATVANDEATLVALLADGHFYSFAFPLGLEDQGGNVVSAANAGELFDLLSECSPDPGPGGCGIGTFGCYQLSYPVTLLLVDGSSVVVNDDDEFAIAVMSGDWAGFGYPLSLIDEDGTETIVNDDDELNEALINCAGIGGPGPGGPGIDFGEFLCYDFVYPFSVTDMMTGATVTFNDSDEWNAYQFGTPGNPPNPFDFAYPLSLTKVDTGVQTTVNNNDELYQALEDCW